MDHLDGLISDAPGLSEAAGAEVGDGSAEGVDDIAFGENLGQHGPLRQTTRSSPGTGCRHLSYTGPMSMQYAGFACVFLAT